MTNGIYLWLLSIATAALPAYAVTRLPAARDRQPYVRLLVFAGVVLFLQPFTLIVMFQVFGVDMLD